MIRCFPVAALVGAIALAGCGGGGGGGAAPVVIQTADLSASKLQFAVGMGTFVSVGDNTVSGPILNMVETFRQPNGTSALLDDTVMLSGPATFEAKSGSQNDGGAPNQVIDLLRCSVALGEAISDLINGPSCTPPNFGTSYNYGASVGGPPAFPRTTDGNYPAGFNYSSIAFDIGANSVLFPKGFPTGNYTLTVSTPPGSSESHTWTASARLAATTTLPIIEAPQVSFDGKGGGSVTLVVPPKLTELFVSLSVTNNLCWPYVAQSSGNTGVQVASGQFALFVKSPRVGALTLAVPDNLGPPTASGSAPTLCSAAQNNRADPNASVTQVGAQPTVTVVGVDYPLYEMSYPQNRTQLPVIAGSEDPDGKPFPQSDITVSAPTMGTAP